MKRLIPAAVTAICCLLSSHVHAQDALPVPRSLPKKHDLFSRLPDKFNASEMAVERLFASAVSQPVRLPLPGNTAFEGVVVTKMQKSAGVTSINIKSSNFDGALLTLSRIQHSDGAVSYLGRIVNIKYEDVLLIAEENGVISFHKEKQSFVIAE